MLAELQQAGLLDSHGQFSIDFGQALQRMGKQALPDARMYVLRLYQSAVCLDATQVEFAGNQSRLHCRILGATPTLDELRGLSRFLTPDPNHLGASYLATALHSALSTRPRSLQLVTWEGQQGASINFSRGQESLRVLDACPFNNSQPQACLILERGPSWFFRQPPEWEWLRRQGGFGLTQLSVNGKSVTASFGAPRDLTVHKLYLPGSYVSVSAGGVSQHVQKGYHVFARYFSAAGESAEDTFRMGRGQGLVTVVGIRADLAGEATLRFVRHGVILEPIRLKATAPGLEILASSAGLKTDLSGLRLIQDEQYKQTCRNLLAQGASVWDQVRGTRSYRNCIAQSLLDRTDARYDSY